ncbi:hypothetical protein N478_08045 [Pseudoalteromonas luteoviolacea S4060-1]|uniref:Uncharacterized protein n=1 Tax=Pseudoalteromonas luteoviolacea S4060-1 TaxID=1365257 RepID=A0A167IKN8_9GAMM|nr:hypothetical protein N478_08045 [Pseudoalteromonas luteoviolacea S4060-1]
MNCTINIQKRLAVLINYTKGVKIPAYHALEEGLDVK